MAETQITRLKNGLTVVTHYNPSEQAFVALDVSVGARHEKPGQEGVAHFIEHMVLKNTKNWTLEQMAEQVRNAYGYSNAFTSPENTLFYYHVNNAYVPQMIKLLADSMQRAEMTPESLKMEAETILREGGHRSSQPNEYMKFGNEAGALVFPKDTRFGADVIGTPQTIKSFTVDDLQKFMKTHYTADRMTLVVAGNVKHEDVVRLAEGYFKDIPKGNGKSADFPPIVPRQGYRTINDPKMGQLIFGMAFPISGNRQNIRDNYKSTLLAIALSGDLATPLYQNLRTQKGLIYMTKAEAEQFADFGTFMVQVGAQPADAPEIVRTMADELSHMDKNLTPETLEQTKSMLIGDFERLYESPKGAGMLLANQIRNYGKEIPLSEVKEVLATITVDEMKEYARKVFSQAPAVVAYGRGADKFPSYQQITSMLGQQRNVDRNGLLLEQPSQDTGKWTSRAAGKPASFEATIQDEKAAVTTTRTSGI